MSQATRNKVISKINEIKSNVESFLADVNVNDLKSSFNLLLKDAQKDFNKLVEQDLLSVKNKLQKERQGIERKAKKFLDGHRRELDVLQAKIEKLLKRGPKAKASSKKAPTKKTAKKAGPKKVTKKVSKKA